MVAANTNIRVEGIAETLRQLDTELGDNGRFYRRTVAAIKKAGSSAVTRAHGFLPSEQDMPSGFTHKNVRGWSVSRVEGRARAFPRYDRQAAISSIRVISARERGVRTDTGWRAGRMFGIAIEMKDPAANIYDVAGNGRSKRQRNKVSSTPKSREFIGLMRAASWLPEKARFRVLLPAVIDTRPEIVNDIRKILDGARVRLNAQRDATWSGLR